MTLNDDDTTLLRVKLDSNFFLALLQTDHISHRAILFIQILCSELKVRMVRVGCACRVETHANNATEVNAEPENMKERRALSGKSLVQVTPVNQLLLN